MSDNVNHPEHYQNIAGVEAIDILNDVVKDLPGKQAALLWNALKYQFRFQKKNGVGDLKKARNYLKYLIDDMESTQDTGEKKTVSETANNIKTDHGPCVIYESKISGHAEVYYSMNMYAGTCTSVAFTNELVRDMFIAKFFNKLGKKMFSIRDVLSDANFVVPNGADTFNIRLPWKDLFIKFICHTEDDKYILDFVYKEDAMKISESSESMKPENDSHIVYKSTVYGSADIYYSKELLAGTCTRILFDDKDGRQTFMIKFFRHLRHCKNGFSIQDVMLDNTYRFHKDDTEFCIHIPWNEIFAGFRMYEEGGQYVLEFVYENDNSEPLLDDEWYAYF